KAPAGEAVGLHEVEGPGPVTDPAAPPRVVSHGVEDGIPQEELVLPNETLPARTGRTQPMGTVAPPLEEQAGGRALTVMGPLEAGPARPEREVNLRPQLRPSQVETAVWAPPVVEAEPVDGVPQETVQVPLEPRSGRTEPMPAVNDMPSSEFVVPAPAPMHVA